MVRSASLPAQKTAKFLVKPKFWLLLYKVDEKGLCTGSFGGFAPESQVLECFTQKR
jgi:hypothetical protein